MKKILLPLFLCFTTLGTAQYIGDKDIRNITSPYIEVTVTSRLLSDKVNVDVDAGQKTKYFSFKNQRSIKDGDRRVNFNSKIDVLNFFLKYGYKLHTVTTLPADLGQLNLRSAENSNVLFTTKFFLTNYNID